MNKINGLYLAQLSKVALPSDMVILDSASSCNIFMNKDLLTDMKNTSKEMILYGNSSEVKTKKMGLYDGVYMWYNLDSIANVLKLSLVSKEYRVVMDMKRERAIQVLWGKNDWYVFKEVGSGLYAYTLRNKLNHTSSYFSSFQISLLETVSENVSKFLA